MGTEEGLGRVRNGAVEQWFDRGLPSNQVRSLFFDHSGTLWAGTAKGAAMYQDGVFVEPAAFKNLRAPVVAIGETPDKQILFAAEHDNLYAYSHGGLNVLEDKRSPEPPLRNIISIHSDKDGLVWMGTNGLGLWLLRDGRFYRFLMTNGLFDGEIYGFASDAHGRLWIACSKGFYSVVKADLVAFADGKIPKIKSFPYVPLGRAIQAKRGVQPNAIAGRDGKLWFSTVEGLISYDPNLGTGHHPPPPVLIEDMTVSGVRTRPSAIRRIGPGRENVSFRYTAFSFLDPQGMTFRYILEGYDRDWTNAGSRREAFYTNLPAGNFRFRVAACAPFVPCNDAGSMAELEVLPYVYQRAWFLPVTIVTFSLLAWLAYRVHIGRLRSQFSLVVAERMRIARELHDTLIQGFSGITMQMQALSEDLRPSVEKQSLEEIIRDAGDCLRATRLSVMGLRDGEKASPKLKEAIAEAAARVVQDRGIRLVLNLEETEWDISAGTKYNLLLILQEAVLNAAKHSGADTVEVSLLHSKEEVRLCISDNGRGVSLPQEEGDSGHYGIIGMKERAHQIGAEFEWTSTPGVGTTVIVRILTKKNAVFARKQGEVKTVS